LRPTSERPRANVSITPSTVAGSERAASGGSSAAPATETATTVHVKSPVRGPVTGRLIVTLSY
jgi:hypothetical protein